MEIETKNDDRLIRRAIREGWPISDDMKKELVEKTYARATCGAPDIEESATKTIVAMDKRNQELRNEQQRKLEAEHARKLQLLELAHKLGIIGNVGAGVGGNDCQPSEGIGLRSSEGSQASQV